MTSQKKCAACGQWSVWTHNVNDKCEHCGKLIDKQGAEDIKKRETLANQPAVFKKRAITPGDSPWQIMKKHVFNVTGAAYFAFLSFMAWLIAVVIH